jgi:hypothetical protein
MQNFTEVVLKNGIVTMVDTEDLPLMAKYTGWYTLRQSNGKLYVRGYDKSRYVAKVRKQKIVSLHRIIMGVNDPKILIDHADHDTLNNRKSNLRLCTQAQNQQNRSGIASHKKSSQYRGVFKRELVNGISWRAGIRYNGKWNTLGHFKDEITAAKVYNEAAKKFFGEFASLNPV